MQPSHFPEVTLLVTHYNRSTSLERLLKAFQTLGCTFGEIVVSDDGSRPEHQEKVAKLHGIYGFRLVSTYQNAGLGNNINKGQDAVQTPYTLYVQEDFRPTTQFLPHFRDALAFMNEDATLDMVRFYAFYDHPIKKPYGKGYSELKFNWWHPSHLKFFCYSDHPHLRRSDFFQKFGRYIEGKSGDETELSMAFKFIKGKGRALFFDRFSTLFDHLNSEDEPSTMRKTSWRESNTIPIRIMRLFYLRFRWMKNTFQLLFTQPYKASR